MLQEVLIVDIVNIYRKMLIVCKFLLGGLKPQCRKDMCDIRSLQGRLVTDTNNAAEKAVSMKV